MWGSVASVVLILLILGWLYGLGAIVQRHVREAVPQEGSYQDLIYRWDLLRVPIRSTAPSYSLYRGRGGVSFYILGFITGDNPTSPR